VNYRVFQYALPVSEDLKDLNDYLDHHRVTQVAQHMVSTPGGPLLVFIVQTAGAAPAPSRSEPRVDYRALLDDDEFALFSQLRDERKKIAEREGVPVYTIFSNAQLAEMVQRKVHTLEQLALVPGVGRARLEKYGTRLLAKLGQPD